MQEGNTKLLKSNKVSYSNSELGTLRAGTARIIIDVVAYFTPDVIFQLRSTELSFATLLGSRKTCGSPLPSNSDKRGTWVPLTPKIRRWTFWSKFDRSNFVPILKGPNYNFLRFANNYIAISWERFDTERNVSDPILVGFSINYRLYLRKNILWSVISLFEIILSL